MMLKRFLVLLLFLAGPVLRADTKLSLVLLSCVPGDYGCFCGNEPLKKGIHVDRLVLSIGDSSVDADMEKISFTDPGDPDYVSHLSGKKVFVWGNHDSKHRLKSLNVISMHAPQRVRRISADTIRGIAKEKEVILFFTSRTPLRLTAYDLDKNTYRVAGVHEYLHCAENVGVKILDSGKVMFRGTGLKTQSAEFEVPQAFLRKHDVDTACTWNLLINNDDYVILHSMGKIRYFIVLDRASGQWMFFQVDESYKDITLHGSFLVLQKNECTESTSIAYLYDLRGKELRPMRLMPFSRIVYYSPSCSLIAQPYRLLLIENRKDDPVIRKIIGYSPAWYIRVLLAEP